MTTPYREIFGELQTRPEPFSWMRRTVRAFVRQLRSQKSMRSAMTQTCRYMPGHGSGNWSLNSSLYRLIKFLLRHYETIVRMILRSLDERISSSQRMICCHVPVTSLFSTIGSESDGPTRLPGHGTGHCRPPTSDHVHRLHLQGQDGRAPI